MTLKIYDTNTRTYQDFIPVDTTHVRMYVCGPTVYDFIHIGNARPLVTFDILYRVLKTLYPKVSYVRNITDIDDKINARALENGEDIRTLTNRTTEQFIADYTALGTLPPDVQPRATEYVGEMIDMIDTLIDKKHAYSAKGHVLFRVKSWAEYGKFAKKDYDAQVAGARVEVASYKQDPADFVLWKPSNDREPGWHSPWGYGRPGWHIECSAMAKKTLGEHFDIHGGGMDLIFPHHQNEIAQSCCANDSGHFAKYWLHNGFLMSEGEKMSKSLGNFYTVRDLLNKFNGMAIRLVLLTTHYRKPLDFTKAKLVDATQNLQKLADTLKILPAYNTHISVDISDFTNALNSDLNTPLALSILWQYRKSAQNTPSSQNTAKLYQALHILGLNLESFREKNESDDQMQAVIALAKQRKTAKDNNDYTTADSLRNQIEDMGYAIKDGADGTFEIYKK